MTMPDAAAHRERHTLTLDGELDGTPSRPGDRGLPKYLDDIIDRNSTEKLKSMKVQREPSDPYTVQEADTVIQVTRRQWGNSKRVTSSSASLPVAVLQN